MSSNKSARKRKSYTKRPESHGFGQASFEGGWSSLGRAVGWGVLLSLILLVVLCTIGAIVAFSTADPDAITAPLALGAMLLSPLAGGVITYRRHRTSPLLCGLLCGLGLLIVTGLAGLLWQDTQPNAWSSLLRWGLRGGMVAFCILGAVMGSYAPRKRRRRRR